MRNPVIRKILFIDLCDTLYPENTTIGFIDNFYEEGAKLSRSRIVKIISKLIFYLTKYDLLRYFYIRKLYGVPRVRLLKDAQDYIDKLIPNEKILKLIGEYKKEGAELYLISASLDPIVEVVAKKFEFTSYFSSSLLYENNGLCLGKLHSDILGEKHTIISKFRKENHNIAFITDNYSDSVCIDLCDDFYAVIPKNKKQNFGKIKTLN
ncbi:haloacid dehalogenase-like hydrolase [Escherichia coli]|uniref:haloacid dehalogenase-like hydrolase n=1 Tax=Escherichia coli TaxID=562 RepID=UPI0003EF5F94|nr:haloacid dehalogenase-like hydrolase [Escherichia coli]